MTISKKKPHGWHSFELVLTEEQLRKLDTGPAVLSIYIRPYGAGYMAAGPTVKITTKEKSNVESN